MKKFFSILAILGLAFMFSTSIVKAATVSNLASGNISSDSYDGASVSVPSIVITEEAAGDIKVGSIILSAPTGYKFDINSVPNIAYAGTGLAGDNAITFIGETIMQFDISNVSTVAGSVTIGSVTPIKIKVTSGTVSAPGNITMSGTITGLDGTSNFGTLTQVPGALPAAGGLTVVTQHAGTETAGTSFTLTITQKDKYGNIIDYDLDDKTCAFTTVATPITETTNIPQYNDVNMTVISQKWSASDVGIDFEDGVATTLGFKIFTAGTNKTIDVSCTGLSTGTATATTIGPAGKAKLAFNTQPSSMSYKNALFMTQPKVEIQDTYGNRTAATDSIDIIEDITAINCNGDQHAGTLSGTLTKAASAGLATFDDLKFDTSTAGANIYLKATSGALTQACSTGFYITSSASSGTTSAALITTATTTTTTTSAYVAPTETTTTTTAPATVTGIPQPAKPVSQMTQTEKTSYIMELQSYLITLLQQLFNALKARLGM